MDALVDCGFECLIQLENYFLPQLSNLHKCSLSLRQYSLSDLSFHGLPQYTTLQPRHFHCYHYLRYYQLIV